MFLFPPPFSLFLLLSMIFPWWAGASSPSRIPLSTPDSPADSLLMFRSIRLRGSMCLCQKDTALHCVNRTQQQSKHWSKPQHHTDCYEVNALHPCKTQDYEMHWMVNSCSRSTGSQKTLRVFIFLLVLFSADFLDCLLHMSFFLVDISSGNFISI